LLLTDIWASFLLAIVLSVLLRFTDSDDLLTSLVCSNFSHSNIFIRKNKLLFGEIMRMSAFYTWPVFWVWFLVHLNNNPRVDMCTPIWHISWFKVNQTLFIYLFKLAYSASWHLSSWYSLPSKKKLLHRNIISPTNNISLNCSIKLILNNIFYISNTCTVMVFSATFNNISVLLVEETGGPFEIHWPAAS
jgi:hypothetical protein